jgi:hypothetical protein
VGRGGSAAGARAGRSWQRVEADVRGLWVVAALLVACAPLMPGRGIDAGAGAPPELGASLNVAIVGDSVRLELHVTNVTEQTLRLEFGSAQRYDFEVSGAGTVWRWSDEMAFAQVVGAEVMLAGESRSYSATWPRQGRTGVYAATARLTSFTHPVELKTPFDLP